MRLVFTLFLGLIAFACTGQSPCSPLTYPDLPPWPIENPLTPWQIQTVFNQDTLVGNAYLKYRCSPLSDSLRKPFIFVEGVDFSSLVEPLRFGDFGWEAFIGESAEYAMLYTMPSVVNALREAGYDVMLLDLKDGAADIEKNAHLLVELLQSVQQWTAGNEPLVLAGASMGGQLTRYALSWMEQEGIPHCCRLWISLDSPHTGAHIPLSIQHCLDFLAEPLLNLDAAQTKLSTTLARPAARQMLRYQLPSIDPLYNPYYSTMDSLGFPQSMRTIGIANGAMDGTLNAPSPGETLFSHEVLLPVIGTTVMELKAYAAPGVGWKLFEGTAPVAYEPYLSDDPCELVPVLLIEETVMNPGVVSLDHVPGGRRPTIEELVIEVNEGITASGCNNDTVESLVSAHSFIPTVSALALPDSLLLQNIAEALALDPQLSPFDVTHGPLGTNEWHSEISDATADLILREVLAGENPLPPILSSSAENGGLFNYRDSATYLVYDVQVIDGGKLRMMGDAPRHWGEAPGPTTTPNGGHMEVRTLPCGSVIRLGEDGEISLGSETGQTATFTLTSGSHFRLAAGGTLHLHAGSKLVIEAGATFAQTGGRIQLDPGAEVWVLNGGEYIYDGGELAFNGPNGGLHLHGRLQLMAGKNWYPISASGELAPLHVYSGVEVIAGAEASVYLRGSSSSNTVLHIHANTELVWPEELSHIYLRDGQVLLDAYAQMEIPVHLHQQHVTTDCPSGDCNGLVLGRDAYADHSIWNNVPIEALLTNGVLRMHDCEINGSHSHVFVKGRTFDLRDTEFNNSYGLGSQSLEFDARLLRCTFHSTGVPADDAAVSDHSDVDLFLEGCFFDDCTRGVSKQGGAMRVQCCHFADCLVGLEVGLATTAYLDPLHGGGFNTFHQNQTGILLNGAADLVLKDGYNTFHQETHQWVLEGWMNHSCPEECEATFNARHNTWSTVWENAEIGLSGPLPDPARFDLFAVDPDAICNAVPDLANACSLMPEDSTPVAETPCLADVPKPDIGKTLYLESEILLVPNPSSTATVLVNASNQEIWLEQITDLKGRTLARPNTSIQPGASQNLNAIQSGILLIHLRTASGEYVQKRWLTLP